MAYRSSGAATYCQTGAPTMWPPNTVEGAGVCARDMGLWGVPTYTRTSDMCGIAGLFSKSLDVSGELGAHLGAMLLQLSDRGPDSAGVAFYRDPAPLGSSKVSLFSPDPDQDWDAVRGELAAAFGAGEVERRATHAVIVVETDADVAQAWLREHHPGLRVMSAGQTIEIYKEKGSPREFIEAFALDQMQGSHALGHTRMATES